MIFEDINKGTRKNSSLEMRIKSRASDVDMHLFEEDMAKFFDEPVLKPLDSEFYYPC